MKVMFLPKSKPGFHGIGLGICLGLGIVLGLGGYLKTLGKTRLEKTHSVKPKGFQDLAKPASEPL